jgi:integrase
MRLKDYEERDGKRVWLSRDELQILIDNTNDNHPEMDAAFLLAGRCGLRRSELVNVTPRDLVATETGQAVRVGGDDDDEARHVPAPPQLTQLALGMAKGPEEPLVTVDPSTIYDWVSRARNRCRAQTGDEGWQYVGPHDMRRSWGVILLQSGVLPSVVMEWGGWEDWKTFRDHYLAEFTTDAIRRERSKVEWLPASEFEDSGEAGYAPLKPGERDHY